jgi:shikimate kinase
VTGNRAKGRENSIAIVGFMGVGKTTVGRKLAERLSMPFMDSDDEIEKAFSIPVAEIFRRHGEQVFREAERKMIAHLIEGRPKVIALGGGAFVDPQTRAALNATSTTIWLDPPFELVVERLARSTLRPLAAGKSPDDLRRLWDERLPHYAHAHIRIATGRDSSEAVETILGALD